MTEAARQARNAYRREWYKKNSKKVLAQQAEYWERKAEKAKQAEQSETDDSKQEA